MDVENDKGVMMMNDDIPENVRRIFEKRIAGMKDKVLVPPPVFEAMQGEFLTFNEEDGILENRFPVLKEQLNPYGTMQGGIIAAAVDNTIGPLSMLVASPNFTRHMELKYRRTILPEVEFVYVTGKLIEQKGRQLFFTASVHDNKGLEYAFAKSMHWIF